MCIAIARHLHRSIEVGSADTGNRLACTDSLRLELSGTTRLIRNRVRGNGKRARHGIAPNTIGSSQ